MSLDKGEGRVTARYGAEFEITTSQNDIIIAKGRSKHREAVCGDFVSWAEESNGSYAIVSLRTRQNALSRAGFRRQSKTLAANIDQILIVTAPEPVPDWQLVDQLLCVVEQLDTDTIILHHKYDLPADTGMQYEWNYFSRIGYQVLKTSVNQMDTIENLENHLAHKTNILVGQSGVGKSSLAQVLLEDADIKIGEVSQATQFGQHTTSVTRLYNLPLAGYLIDSPGVRDFTPDNLDRDAIHSGFREIAQLGAQCRFHNCLHLNEPECAVKAALEHNEVSRRRYESYLKLMDIE